MKDLFYGKKIILAITPDVEIYKCFQDNLEYLGFEVILICNISKFKYKNRFQKVINFFKKTIFNDKSYKTKLKKEFYLKTHLETLSKITQADYSLTIRADLFDIEVIEKIISISNKNYAYQWDGMNRFPNIYKLISLFDKFYVFDKKDISLHPKTYPLTNFYFDCYYSELNNSHPKYDVYYLATQDNRVKKLIPIAKTLYQKGLKLNILFFGKPKININKYPYFKFLIKRRLSYFENLQLVSDSKIIIDIHHEKMHSGLSFRPFEALGYSKKLITTNPRIKEFDFYNPNNIFIANENLNSDSMEPFLQSDYEKNDPAIKTKYSFTNWIKHVLEREDTISINIP